jgi:hypothetical protein
MKKIKLIIFIVFFCMLMLPMKSFLINAPKAMADDCLPGDQGYFFLDECVTPTGKPGTKCERPGTGCNVHLPCCE